MKRKVAIAGLEGAAERIHLPAFSKLPDLQIVGGCDPAAGRGKFPFPLFPSAEEMLEKTRHFGCGNSVFLSIPAAVIFAFIRLEFSMR